MFRPPYVARVAAGAAVYALEESRRLPSAALNFPVTAISQLLQTSMHIQQFVTSLALKGDAVFDRFGSGAQEQPSWATFDEDLEATPAATVTTARASRFDLFTEDTVVEDTRIGTNGRAVPVPEFAAPAPVTESEPEPVDSPDLGTGVTEPEGEIAAPEIATRYDFANMTLAQLRARLRMLTLDDLVALLDYEERTQARAPFVTMLTNRIATVRAQ